MHEKLKTTRPFKILRTLAIRMAVYAYYSGRPNLIDPINPIYHLRRRREEKARMNILQEASLWSLLSGMMSKSDSTGCEFGDYWELYRSVMERRPRAILECGSGISSCVIAYAVRKLERETGRRPDFFSMEENQFYHEQVVAIFPDELRPFVTFVRSDRQEGDFNDIRGCFYKDLPDKPFDFVFVDGPTERRNAGAVKCFNADIISVLKWSNAPVFGLLDQRVTTYWALRQLLPGGKVHYRVIKKMTEIQADRHALHPELC